MERPSRWKAIDLAAAVRGRPQQGGEGDRQPDHFVHGHSTVPLNFPNLLCMDCDLLGTIIPHDSEDFSRVREADSGSSLLLFLGGSAKAVVASSVVSSRGTNHGV